MTAVRISSYAQYIFLLCSPYIEFIKSDCFEGFQVQWSGPVDEELKYFRPYE